MWFTQRNYEKKRNGIRRASAITIRCWCVRKSCAASHTVELQWSWICPVSIRNYCSTKLINAFFSVLRGISCEHFEDEDSGRDPRLSSFTALWWSDVVKGSYNTHNSQWRFIYVGFLLLWLNSFFHVTLKMDVLKVTPVTPENHTRNSDRLLLKCTCTQHWSTASWIKVDGYVF